MRHADQHAPPLLLAFRRIGIPSVRIFFSNLAVSPMNNQLRMLVPRNCTRDTDCFSLSRGSNCSLGITRAFYLPATLRMWRYMLVLTHNNTSFQTNNAPAMRTFRRIGYGNNLFSATTDVIPVFDSHKNHLVNYINKAKRATILSFSLLGLYISPEALDIQRHL